MTTFLKKINVRNLLSVTSIKSVASPYQFMQNKALSNLINNEMAEDSFFHPNLGGVTNGGMSNHYPMTIMSLAGLGADDEAIIRFRQLWPRYRAHVSKDLALVDTGEVTLDNWCDYLGESNRLLEFQRVFLLGINKFGITEFTRQALEKMKLSLPMGLFHPLIQLSFAVDHGDQKLIANALAYFAIRYQRLYLNIFPQLNSSTKQSNTELLSTQGSSISAQIVWGKIHQQRHLLQFSFRPLGGTVNTCEKLCAEKAVQQLAFPQHFDINQDNLFEKVAEISEMAI